MREIKFRAWDSHSKQMITDVLVWTRKNGWTSVLLPHGIKNEKAYAVIGDHWKIDDFGNKYSDLNVVVPMQYTGLHDRNGKEIYEGDIIRRYGGGLLGNPQQVLATGEVCYNAPSFNIKCRENEWANMFNASELEVIGNIYEHPELLAPSNQQVGKQEEV